MFLKNKESILVALSAFQIGSTASAMHVSADVAVAISEDKKTAVICQVSRLDRAAVKEWPGEGYVGRHQSNQQILQDVDASFAGGKYFDAYPHKLPALFRRNSCSVYTETDRE